MKPTAADTRRRTGGDTKSTFPAIDCNYQVFSLDRYYGGSTGSSPASFLSISRDYFRHEARRNFLAEVAFFLVFGAILIATFVEGARVIIHFLLLPAA
jgi:hypothetical protein